jgi:hypothetical protein
MNTTYAMQAGWRNGSTFRGDPFLAVPTRGPLETQLDELKDRLLQGFVSTVANTALVQDLRWAANEAAALAWYTACPILILPSLLEEKVRTTLRRWEMQERIRRL